MFKKLGYLLLTLSIFSGCSVKEFNDGVDSITGDISDAWNRGYDKSRN